MFLFFFLLVTFLFSLHATRFFCYIILSSLSIPLNSYYELPHSFSNCLWFSSLLKAILPIGMKKSNNILKHDNYCNTAFLWDRVVLYNSFY